MVYGRVLCDNVNSAVALAPPTLQCPLKCGRTLLSLTNPMLKPAVRMMTSLRSLFQRYCDGNSFSGNRDEGQQVQGLDNKTVPIYYRGRRNIDATLATLVKEYNFGKAENVLLTGCSVSVPAVHVYAVSCTSL